MHIPKNVDVRLQPPKTAFVKSEKLLTIKCEWITNLPRMVGDTDVSFTFPPTAKQPRY